jgi:hypothetical protein
MGVFGRKVHVTETPDVRHITNPDVMHEESDVSVKGVALFVFGLGVFGLITIGVMFGLFRYFGHREARNEEKEFHSPMARSEQERQPAQGVPHLQAAPGDRMFDAPDTKDPRYDLQLKPPDEEWKLLRQKYDWDLTHYSPPDPSTGMVRVPIDEAMQRLLQQNLPARPAQPGDPTVNGGMDVPSYASAGRQTEKRDGGEQ